MAADELYETLGAFLESRGDALLATATLLAGSRHGGEDLLQGALERLLRRRGRLNHDYEGYLRKTMCNLAIDHWRHRRRRPEALVDAEPAPTADHADQVDLRQSLLGALRQLPASQRAALVLRYWNQMTEADTAKTLGCSVGTVKSATSRGLQRLRLITAAWDAEWDTKTAGAATKGEPQ